MVPRGFGFIVFDVVFVCLRWTGFIIVNNDVIIVWVVGIVYNYCVNNVYLLVNGV